MTKRGTRRGHVTVPFFPRTLSRPRTRTMEREYLSFSPESPRFRTKAMLLSVSLGYLQIASIVISKSFSKDIAKVVLPLPMGSWCLRYKHRRGRSVY